MGKWSHLKDEYPRFVNPDESWRERVERFKDTHADKPCEHGRTKVLQHFEANGSWWAELDDGCVHETPIIRTLSKVELARRRIAADLIKDRFEEKVKALNVALEAYAQLIYDRLEDEGETAFKLDDGSNTFVKDEIYVGTEDKAQLYEWIRANGLEDLFTVNYQTLASMIKKKIEDGEELPPGVKLQFKPTIQQRKGKGE